ncbi:MAG: histidine kinase [Cytophagales bacterium]|nr:MAG: histidine kinase [Cytophagales bacterium]
MAVSVLILISFGYLLLLFVIAQWAENSARKGRSLINNGWVYALSLTVYCTAWTYYGSVGHATRFGIDFLAIYIGPTLAAPLFWLVIRKMIRICKTQHITNLADFISTRYGKNIELGVLVTLLCLLGILPYIAIQLKAISVSFNILQEKSPSTNTFFLYDTSFYITLGLALFTILFGTRKVDVTERHEGIVAAIAFEAVIKLVAFCAVGIFVCWGAFDTMTEIFEKANQHKELQKLFLMNDYVAGRWFYLCSLSMLAIMLLPRQFQVTVVENVSEKHINKAIWLFPLYLLIINLFVLPIAFGGKILLGDTVDPDTFVLSVPLYLDQKFLAVIAYIGGFSAASSMLIVSTIALSVMVSNNLITPLFVKTGFFQTQDKKSWQKILIYSRRISIIFILYLAYLYFVLVASRFSLVSIGLISFVAVAQFAPSILLGIYWKGGNRVGAIAGMLLGFIVWFYTLVVPTIVEAGFLPQALLKEGFAGLVWLKPTQLFGLNGLDPLSQAFFWSMLFNFGAYMIASFWVEENAQEHNQAEIFVNIYQYSTSYESVVVWKGSAFIPDIISLMNNFLGEIRTQKALKVFAQKYQSNFDPHKMTTDPQFINYAERLLAGSLGAVSARMMIASVVREEQITKAEVVNILKQSQKLIKLNTELEKTSKALQNANAKLKKMDKLKDDFISTITHELRTPITSIKAFSEILVDNTDLEEDEQQHFLHTIIRETNRMERLISQVLDLEKLQSGNASLHFSCFNIHMLIKDCLDTLKQIVKEKNIQIDLITIEETTILEADYDRITQVMLNLLYNAIKFCNEQNGIIKIITTPNQHNQLEISVIDNGKGIDPQYHEVIFHKFYQAENQQFKKPKGSGLGLAICKQIIESHQGKIWVENLPENLTKFSFLLPLQQKMTE